MVFSQKLKYRNSVGTLFKTASCIPNIQRKKSIPNDMAYRFSNFSMFAHWELLGAKFTNINSNTNTPISCQPPGIKASASVLKPAMSTIDPRISRALSMDSDLNRTQPKRTARNVSPLASCLGREIRSLEHKFPSTRRAP